ncbi:MAG: SPOR domain-containing protein [Alphaproteobacteria bacterium]
MTHTKEISWSPSAPRQHGSVEVLGQQQRGYGYVHPAAIQASFQRPEYGYRSRGGDRKETYSGVGGLSLLSIGFSLMLLGICFFGSGFWVGCWFAGKDTATSSLASLSLAPGKFSLNANHANALLEIVGAAGGNIGRVAGAAQRVMEAERQTATPMEGNVAQNSANIVNTTHATPMIPGLTTTVITSPQTSEHSASSAMAAHDGLSPSPQTLYSIQLGAYAARANAVDLMHQLQQELAIPTFLVEGKNTDGTPVFYVRAGSYHPFGLAKAAAKSIAEQSNLTAIVVATSPGEKRLSQ